MLNVLHGFIVFQEVYIMTTTSRPALITRIWSFSVLNSNTHFLKSRNNNKLDYFCRPRLSQLEGNQGIFQKRKPLFVILRQFSSRKTIFNILMQISSYFEDHTLLSLLSILSFTLCFTEKKVKFQTDVLYATGKSICALYSCDITRLPSSLFCIWQAMALGFER